MREREEYKFRTRKIFVPNKSQFFPKPTKTREKESGRERERVPCLDSLLENETTWKQPTKTAADRGK